MEMKHGLIDSIPTAVYTRTLFTSVFQEMSTGATAYILIVSTAWVSVGVVDV